ncbi:MAG: conserved membrane protein of unknown function [Promethearchaeota archaeon]|nr:MAG: conserved membrane protein of unknown function [Candidatus Lokiarchaeota archaeon]
MSTAIQRCPRCGNENRSDSFACTFCGKRLRIEQVEKVPIFKRIEEEWTNPYPWYMKFFYLLINPARAFWDINHLRKSAPGYIILLMNSLMYALIGWAFTIHFQFISIGGVSPPFALWVFVYDFSFFLGFFLFGLMLQFLFYKFLIWLYTLGANYSVGFTERIESRFGTSPSEGTKYKDRDLSPFSIYKGGTLLQKQEAYKSKVMFCAFFPFLIANFINFLVVLIGFPNISLSVSGLLDPSIFSAMIESDIWVALYTVDGLVLAIWVPILITVAIRELSNSSTWRVLIPSFGISILIAVFFYFLRPVFFS